MKKPSPSTLASEIDKLQALSESVGDFIRYWGFRRIHGQIWTQVFLSKQSLSGAELTERLQVSKALVSPALTELEEYGLIFMQEDGGKTKRYTANPDVLGVIRDILKKREAKLIEESDKNCAALQKAQSKLGSHSGLDENRLEELKEMISVAQFALKFLLKQSDEEIASEWAPLAHKGK